MSGINKGGYVYPMWDGEVTTLGISRRDWLAGMAMQGLMDAYARSEIDDYLHNELAHDAYHFADAMIEEGNK